MNQIICSPRAYDSIEAEIDEIRVLYGQEFEVTVEEPSPHAGVDWALPAVVAVLIFAASSFFQGLIGQLGADVGRKAQKDTAQAWKTFKRIFLKSSKIDLEWITRSGLTVNKSPPMSLHLDIYRGRKYSSTHHFIGLHFVFTRDLNSRDWSAAKEAMEAKIRSIMEEIDRKEYEIQIKLQNPKRYYGLDDSNHLKIRTNNDFSSFCQQILGTYLFDREAKMWLKVH